jgi:hypothetical protein
VPPPAAAAPPIAESKPAPATVMPPRPRVLPPPPRVIPPAASPASNVTAAPTNYPGSGSQAGPKKETARISILPEPVRQPAPTVKMTKTQPLLAATPPRMQTIAAPSVPQVTHPSAEAATTMLDAVPLPVCWTIFGVSAVTLLIQIWNYFGS